MLETISQLGVLGLTALVTGIIYVFLAGRANYYAWFFGITSCAIIAYEDFTRYALFADGALQVFYVVIGFYALIEWREQDESGNLNIKKMQLKPLVRDSTGVFILSILLGLGLNFYTTAELPILDSITSVFAVYATWLLVRRFKENWWYWMVINTLYIYIYGRQGAWFYVVLALIYTGVSIYGLIQWQKIHRKQQ